MLKAPRLFLCLTEGKHMPISRRRWWRGPVILFPIKNAPKSIVDEEKSYSPIEKTNTKVEKR